MLKTASSSLSGKDEFGMPLAKIVHSFDQDAVALWNANFEEGLTYRQGHRCQGIRVGTRQSGRRFFICSAAPLWALAPAVSIADSYGQTHEISNRWVAGPGLFPTEGASNPTFTIFAVSQRGAEQLVSKWGTIAG